MSTWEAVNAVVSHLRERFGEPPVAAVVLGSGLSRLLSDVELEGRCVYADVGLPSPGVEGHAGQVGVARLSGRRVALLAGRLHLYEGHPVDRVALTVRALSVWGVQRFVLTSAVGALDPDLAPGTLVQISDHINLMGQNPLVGPNVDELGARFPDMTEAWCPALAAAAHEVAAEVGVTLRQGVYAAVLGPSFETPAEVRMLRMLGGHVVGMSVVPEVISLVHAGRRVLGVAVVSNLAAGLSGGPLAHESVQDVVAGAVPSALRLLEGLAARW